MAATRQLKSRIRSVKNTRQITRAMQMVAASKMRRAQDAVKASQAYSQAAQAILAHLKRQGQAVEHPHFKHREVKRRLLIVIASDKGLAGAYNTNILRAYVGELSADRAADITTETIAVGRKAGRLATRLVDNTVLGVYEDLPDYPVDTDMRPFLQLAQQRFELSEVDAVDLIYTRFISSMSQVATVKRILPAGIDETPVTAVGDTVLFEPNLETVLDQVARRLVESQVFQALLDARASEHSMRMIAMKNATDNASDLVEDLTLEMNKARQAGITRELAEISGGVEALEQA